MDKQGPHSVTQPNAIILTSGITGSSVFTGLISRAGYWTGDTTFRKSEYDTYENEELIQLNEKLLKEAGYTGDYTREFSHDAISAVASLFGKTDARAYRIFVDKCNARRPWVWKDPRLWLTIRFWKNFLKLDDCRFILITRDLMQSWVSQTLRRRIQTYRYTRYYEEGIKNSIISFFTENNLRHLHLQYDELVFHPDKTLQAINGYLQTNLTVSDLSNVYHKPLYRRARRSMLEHVKAVLIYMKNYSERLDLAPNRTAEDQIALKKPSSD